MWDNRFSWSGEIPTDYPDLNPVALQRVTPAQGKKYADSIVPSREWERLSDGSLDGNTAGPFGKLVSMNRVNPASEKGRFVLPHFDGLWPSSGKLLIGLWVKQSYAMTFSPLLSTRGGDSNLVYMSTSSSGRIRHGVYDAAGALVLDEYESTPWTGTTDYQFVGQVVDFDAETSQMFSVDRDSKAAWTGEARALTGAPNPASTADLDVFSLQTANYWTSGVFDEVIVAHPGAGFDVAEFADAMARGLWADGQSPGNVTAFNVSESGVTGTGGGDLATGAERVEWERLPTVQGAPAGAVAHTSTDKGATWESGELTAPFSGLLRWTFSLDAGDSFDGITVTEPTTPPPTLGALDDVTMEQGEILNVALDFTVSGDPEWSVTAPDVVAISIGGKDLSVVAGFKVGDGPVVVTLTDDLGREASRTFKASVKARAYQRGAMPDYPDSPVILWGDDGPEAVLIDPESAVVTKEVNGELIFEMKIPAGHKHAHLIQPERIIQVAGERYRTRRITTSRKGGPVVLEVYAEARFYDLATAGRIDAREFRQVVAGDVMKLALKGTGWKIGVANVTTLRTYEVENTNPLELLRTVQKNHGGDLIFDNENRVVSLVTSSGRDIGVAFFYGNGLTDSKRVVDTTSLVTRIYARNADGLTISGVNGGKKYLENFDYTSEVREATYEFKSGTSPYTMLSMAKATLANRSTPKYSYEVTVTDLSSRSGDDLDKFDAGDRVTVVDHEVGISETQRIVGLEYDVVRPWASELTLSAKLRELGGSTEDNDAGVLDTGGGNSVFDLVPFNLLLNSRFDNDLAHWAHHGAKVTDGNGTGDYAVQFSGAGVRWIEQTVQPDNRGAYALSFDLESDGPEGWSPDVSAQAVITYEDGKTETIELDLS
ncbi:phage tail spike protein [Arthrobacter rhombi]|uniref:phage tail spike protein n=1 Tax=Arthrobacter rhombi TaxID=71253 RepID=UPI003FD3C04B